MAALVAISCTACAQQADFNEVGKQMAIMLQNSHFARLDFQNPDLNHQFLDDYLKDLDFQRLYFTKEDVDGFNARFGDKISDFLIRENCMMPATEIYKVFQKRVAERVALTESLLAGPDFDFTKDESVMVSRKDARWPKNDQEANALWTLQIKEAVLGETLRRELLAKYAKEQGKPEPTADRTPKEKVSLRYKRFQSAVNDIDDEEIANYFLSAVARACDPHTDYMSFREMNRFKDLMKNELVGIGAQLQSEEDGATKIMGIVIGGPADRGGMLKLNDRVVAVDSLNTGKPEDMVDIMFMKIDRVVDLIRGSEGTSVGLKVEPSGGAPGETKIIVIQRGKVEMKDEQASGDIIEMKDGEGAPHRLGLITLPSFYDDFEEGKVHCSVDVERILKRLMEEKIEGLVLDLRNNGGGSLEQVRRMTGFFVDSGPVVQVKNNRGKVEVKDSDSGKALYTGPMVVAIDKTSASASEILAGALQDFNRAVIVGDSSTFGKGTVQQPMDIGKWLPLFAARNRAGSLKVTIQKFYRPSGSSTQVDGVESQVTMPSLMDAMEVGEKYLDHCLPHDRINPAANFKPLDPAGLFVAALKEKSRKRITENQDYLYLIEDIVKTKDRLKRNQLSLNKEVRKKELTESDTLQKTRNLERNVRFAAMAAKDRKDLTFYKITLETLDQNLALKPYVPGEAGQDYMRRVRDEAEELDQTPKWPTDLDLLKRETLYILRDFVELTENARVAGVSK